jgi:glucuronide carrier protein
MGGACVGGPGLAAAMSADVPPAGRRVKYLGYAAGDVANNLTFTMTSAFLLIYYTDVAGIAAGTAGTLFLVVRVWGGIADLLAGAVVDKVTSRWGKFRPYLVTMSIPLLLMLVAMFSIPGGLGHGATLAWAYVTYSGFMLCYSFVNIPYGSLSAAMTQEPDVRAKLSTARSLAASLTILAVAGVVSPQISGSDDLQRSLTITTAVFAVVGYLLYLWCFRTSQETVARGVATVTLRDTFGMLRNNKPLLLLCASSFAFLTGMFSLQTVGVYYARDVLGNADLFIVLTVVQTVGMVIASTVMPKAVEVVGKKQAYVVAGLVGAAGGIGVMLAPDSVPAVGIALFGVLGFGLGMINTLIFAFQADTVDYGEWRSGVRTEGTSYAVLSFTRKAGQGLGGALAAYTIGIGGYVSGATNDDGALRSIRVAAGGLPAVLFLVATAVMLAYPLTEKAFRRMIAEMAQRRAAGDVASVAGR